jgi:hypothetical protein
VEDDVAEVSVRDDQRGSGGRTYLVYADNGMRLVYAGDDAQANGRACDELASSSAGHIYGFQFVGRQRYELRAFFDEVPSDAFLAARFKRDLFDFTWTPRSETEEVDARS